MLGALFSIKYFLYTSPFCLDLTQFLVINSALRKFNLLPCSPYQVLSPTLSFRFSKLFYKLNQLSNQKDLQKPDTWRKGFFICWASLLILSDVRAAWGDDRIWGKEQAAGLGWISHLLHGELDSRRLAELHSVGVDNIQDSHSSPTSLIQLYGSSYDVWETDWDWRHPIVTTRN